MAVSHIHIAVAPLVLDIATVQDASMDASACSMETNDDSFALSASFQLHNADAVPSPLLIRALLDAKFKLEHPMEAWFRDQMGCTLMRVITATRSRPRRRQSGGPCGSPLNPHRHCSVPHRRRNQPNVAHQSRSKRNCVQSGCKRTNNRHATSFVAVDFVRLGEEEDANTEASELSV